MADKRKLLLEVDVDVDSKPLRQLGDDAENAEDGFEDLNKGLKRLDDQFRTTTNKLTDLRKEFARTGDDALLKDIQKAEREYKRLGREAKSIFGVDPTVVRKAGADAGGIFAEGIATGLKTIAKSPAGIGAIVGLGAAAAPYLGAVVAAGVIGAAGAGGIIGGIKVASKSAEVQSAAKSLGSQITNQLDDAFQPFTKTTVGAIHILQDEVRKAQPDLERLGAATARYIEPLSRDIGGGARAFLDGVADAAEKAGPVLREVGDGIERLGITGGQVFSGLGDTGPSAAIATRDSFSLLNDTLRISGEQLEFLSNTYGAARAAQSLFSGDLGVFAQYVTDSAVAERDAKQATAELSAEQERLNAAARNVNVDLAAQIGYLNTIRGNNLSAAESTVAYKDAINGAKSSLENKNKVTLDEEKALLRAVSAANQNVEALGRSGATADQASGAFNRHREQLIKVATQMGMSRAKASEYIDKLLQIPGNINTKYSTAGIPTALGQLAELRAAINRLPSEKRTKYIIETNRVTIRTDKGGKQALSEGGPVKGPGPKGIDSVDALLAPGEYVLNSRTVDKLGGLRAVDRLAKGAGYDAKSTAASMARSAGPGSAKAGRGDTHLHLTVMNYGPVASSSQFETMVETATNTLIRKGKLDAVST
jgi:hypothetical protein